MRIILASQSERRYHLLKEIFDDFEVIVPDIDEVIDEALDPTRLAVLNARIKAENVASNLNDKNCLIISADTIVVADNRIFGKPENYDTAFMYLKGLSGTVHRVITGCCIFNPGENKILTDFDISYVKFRNLSESQIKSFLDRQTFYDKAGGYAVQEIKDEFVEEIHGSYKNVVGLPVELLRKMLLRFRQLKETEIFDIGFPGTFGVGKCNGKTIFVEDSVPGDIIWFYIKKDKGNFAFAENCGIKQCSDFRVSSKCPHFGVCGGCAFQNLDYEFQLHLKKKYLTETLTRIGKIETYFEIEETVRSPDIYGYRNKMEFAFGSSNKKIFLGLRERQSPLKRYTGRVNRIETCSIFSDFVENLFPVFIDFAENTGLEPYNPFTKKGNIRHLVVRHAKNTDEIMLILVTKSELYLEFSGLVESLTKKMPNITSFWWVKNDQISDVVSFGEKQLVYGRPFIEERFNNMIFRIYPETFFQPNTKTAEKLYEVVLSFVRQVSARRMLGLFCGSGPIEIFCSGIVEKITGVDNNPINIKTALENAKNNNIKNCDFLCLSAEEFLKENVDPHNYDLVLVDPPRGGLTQKAISQIIKLGPKFVIYVSCNPSTLARDIGILAENGYRLRKITPVDMFPHTSHLESCSLIEMQ